MQLTQLMEHRAAFSPGELSQISIGVVRDLASYHGIGECYGPLSLKDIYVFSDGSAGLTPSAMAQASDDDAARLAEVAHLAGLLLALVKRTGRENQNWQSNIIKKKSRGGQPAELQHFANQLDQIRRNPDAAGSVALQLAISFPSQPIDFASLEPSRRSTIALAVVGVLAVVNWGLAWLVACT